MLKMFISPLFFISETTDRIYMKFDIFLFTRPLWEKYSSVGVVIKLRAGRYGVRLQAGETDLSLHQNVLDWLRGPPSLLLNGCQERFTWR